MHIVQRGHNRCRCFYDAEDFENYLHWLYGALEESHSALHAYVLMDNHVHLLLTPSEAESAARLFMSLGSRFVRYMNRKYERTGTMWERRYHSSLVQSEGHLLRCHHYIEHNPVRAYMVDDAFAYRWSSFKANAYGERNPLITPHPVYTSLGSLAETRQLAYRNMAKALLTPDQILEIRQALCKGVPLGDHDFRLSVEKLTQLPCGFHPAGRPRRLDR